MPFKEAMLELAGSDGEQFAISIDCKLQGSARGLPVVERRGQRQITRKREERGGISCARPHFPLSMCRCCHSVEHHRDVRESTRDAMERDDRQRAWLML